MGQTLGAVNELEPSREVESVPLSIRYLRQALRYRSLAGRAGEEIGPVQIATRWAQIAAKAESLSLPEWALESHREALYHWREAKDRSGEARTLSYLGRLHRRRGDLGEAQKAYQEARLVLQISGLVGNRGLGPARLSQEASTLFHLGKLAEEQQEIEPASQYFEQAYLRWREADDNRGQAEGLNALGSLAIRVGSPRQAERFFRRALPFWEAIGDRRGVAITLTNLGTVHEKAGDWQLAVDAFRNSLPSWQALGDAGGEGIVLAQLTRLYAAADLQELALKSYLSLLRRTPNRDDPRVRAGLLRQLPVDWSIPIRTISGQQ
jgi:tetratricopeptide (TPR) repeat protein